MMRAKIPVEVIGAAIVVLSVPSIHAATLALYDFTDQPGNQEATSVTSTHPNLTASDITRGLGLAGNNGNNSMSARNWSLADLDPDDYFEFTVAPNAGYKLTIDVLQFGERRSGTGPRDFTIRSSIDSFTTDLIAPFNMPDSTSNRNQTLPLLSPLTDVNLAVKFRIYGYSAVGNTGTWRLQNHTDVGGLALLGEVMQIGDPPTAPGDFDGDGDVDGADFVVWQTNFPKQSGATLATGDADGDGDVDGADFVIWQTNFPFTPSSAVVTVAEPSALLLLAIGGMLTRRARVNRRL